MNISNVADKILSDANEEKQKILDEAKKKSDEIIKKAEKEKSAILKEVKEKAKLRYKEVYDMELLKAESAFNQKILEYKLSYIDEALNKVSKKLKDVSQKQYEKFLSKVFEEINIEEGEFIIGDKGKAINDKLIKSIANKHKISLKKSKIKPDFEKGLRIIKDRAQYNISPVFQFKENIDMYRMEISAILFSKED